MTYRSYSFCSCCHKEFLTVGPELHLPDCRAMLAEGILAAAKLGYVAKDDRTKSFSEHAEPFFRGWDEDGRSY